MGDDHMSYQENSCGSRSSRCPGLCSVRTIGFFVVVLAAALGLIFGAVYAEPIFASLASVIVLAIVLAAIIVGLLIWRWCECRQ